MGRAIRAAVCAGLLVALTAVFAGPAVRAAGPVGIPLASPAPGGPVFVSFKNTFEDSLSSTLFDITAQGSGLAYVWSLQNVTCGSLGQPQTRDPKNAYVHPSCALPTEILVRVTVLVAKATDLNPDGTPKNDDVARFVYSQIARAADGDPATANVPKAPTLQYFGPAASAATASAAASVAAPVVATESTGSFPWIVLVVIGLGLAAIVGYVLSRRKKDPCEAEKRREAAAKAALEAARARQKRIAELKAANDKAQADLQRAQSAATSAHDPNHTSWVQDVATGRTVYMKTDQAAMDRADATLKAATDAATAAKGAYEGAGNGGEITQAQYAVEDATRELQRAEEALARCLELNAPPPPTTTSTPPPVVPPTVSRPPTPPTQVRHECEDGDEPQVDTREADFELYLLWAAQWAVDGPFQFSQDDVDKAFEGFKNFKTMADIAGFVQGFAGAGGAAAVGDIDVGSVLNIFTTGADRVSDYLDQPSWTDPSGAAGWGVEKALDVLINKMRPKRLLGSWSISVPLVKVHATCTRTKECRGNRWVLVDHKFDLAYGDLVRMGHGGPIDNLDNDRPERGYRQARAALVRPFNNANRAAMAKIQEMVRSCARG